MERLRSLVRMLMEKNRIWLTCPLQEVHFYEKDYCSSNFKVIKQKYQDIKISVLLYEKWGIGKCKYFVLPVCKIESGQVSFLIKVRVFIHSKLLL